MLNYAHRRQIYLINCIWSNSFVSFFSYAAISRLKEWKILPFCCLLQMMFWRPPKNTWCVERMLMEQSIQIRGFIPPRSAHPSLLYLPVCHQPFATMRTPQKITAFRRYGIEIHSVLGFIIFQNKFSQVLLIRHIYARIRIACTIVVTQRPKCNLIVTLRHCDSVWSSDFRLYLRTCTLNLNSNLCVLA